MKEFFSGFKKKMKGEIPLNDGQIKEILSDKNIIISEDTQRENRIPPGQHEVKKWPVLHAGRVQNINNNEWKFRIFGLVEEEKELSYNEFMSLPKAKVFSDVHCVTSWSKLNNLWEGIGSSTIKEIVNILPEAKFVMIHAEKNFTTNLRVEEFFESDVIFATKHNLNKINSKHGAPVRLVVPRLYFWKSAKWVTGVEFMAEDRPGFWESNGYHNHGDPWKEERYSWQGNYF